ncbi:polysaccharide biosynthesis protein [Chloroflexota bacterium]
MSWRIIAETSRRYHLKRVVVWGMVDAFIVVIVYSATFFARVFVTPQELWQSMWFILLAAGINLICLYLFGVYHRIWSQSSGNEVSSIVGAVAVATWIILPLDILVGASYLLEGRPLPVSVVVIGNALALMGFVGVRYRSRLNTGLSWRWQAVWNREFPTGKPIVRVLVVGAGEAGQMFVWRLKHRWSQVNNTLYEVVGFVDDDPDKHNLYIEGSRVLGSSEDIPRLVALHGVDLIVIAIHNISGPDFRRILNYCETSAARIKIIPDTFALVEEAVNVPLLRDVAPEDILGRQPVGRHEGIDFSAVTGKRVLVTGAAGSIGSELCRQLINYDPLQLVMLDNNESGLYDLLVELKDTATPVVPVLGDITRQESVESVFAQYQPQVVFHTAAYKHVPMLEMYPHEAVRVNVGGTRRVATLARKAGVERFVLISTDKAVSATGVMGASKRLCELLVLSLAQSDPGSTLFAVVRFGNVLGSRGSVVPVFSKQIDRGGPVTVTDMNVTRYFMTIPEAVNLVIHAACLTHGGDLYMLQMGEMMRIVELAERLIRMRGLRPYTDIEILFTGLRPGEKLHEMLHFSEEEPQPTLHPHIVQLERVNDMPLAGTTLLQAVDRLLADHASSNGAVYQANEEQETAQNYLQHLTQCAAQAYPSAATKPPSGKS